MPEFRAPYLPVAFSVQGLHERAVEDFDCGAARGLGQNGERRNGGLIVLLAVCKDVASNVGSQRVCSLESCRTAVVPPYKLHLSKNLRASGTKAIREHIASLLVNFRIL